MESIIQEIFKDISLEQDELKSIHEKLEKVTLKKGDYLLKSGEVVKDIFYIKNGCLRTYFLVQSEFIWSKIIIERTLVQKDGRATLNI